MSSLQEHLERVEQMVNGLSPRWAERESIRALLADRKRLEDHAAEWRKVAEMFEKMASTLEAENAALRAVADAARSAISLWDSPSLDKLEAALAAVPGK